HGGGGGPVVRRGPGHAVLAVRAVAARRPAGRRGVGEQQGRALAAGMTRTRELPRTAGGRETTRRLRLTVEGVVHGVGFRPFVYRLATELGATGFVGNDSRSVFAEIQGPEPVVDEFLRRLRADAPPLARITAVRSEAIPPDPAETGFRIVASRDAGGARTLVPPDVAVCRDCVREIGRASC